MVQPGDSVTLGQVIGRLGTSGASAAPHLHLQVNEAPWKQGRAEASIFGEGIPYVHPRFDVVGEGGVPYCSCSGTDYAPEGMHRREGELPVDNVVVRFPDEGPRTDGGTAHLAAVCLIQSAGLMAEQYRIAEALEALADARSVDPNIDIPAETWRGVCWHGVIAGRAQNVLSACDDAVNLEPGYGAHLSARGVARALIGDLAGAIADLEAYLDWRRQNDRSALSRAAEDGLGLESDDDLSTQVEAWIGDLRDGENPFSNALLEEFRSRTQS